MPIPAEDVFFQRLSPRCLVPYPDNLLQLHPQIPAVIEAGGSAVGMIGQRERDKKSHSQTGSANRTEKPAEGEEGT
jgi:hypothetical protein